MTSLEQQARNIYAAAMRAVDVRTAVQRSISHNATSLTLGETTIPLAALDKLFIIAVGKAAVPMHEAAAAALPNSLSCKAVVISPEPPASTPHALHLRGVHPTPDERSYQAADAVLDLLAEATPRTAVLFLVSGGVSAMLERPLDPSITLTDIAAFHRALVGSGLPIAKMNALRKHVSAVKGGRLALAAAAARAQVTLLISDVPAATPDAIGSGPSLPDTTTLADCQSILQQLRKTTALPQSIDEFFTGPLCVETPKAIDAAFARASWSVILSGEHFAVAAANAAQAAGFHVETDTACDEGEYRDTARTLLNRSATLAQQHPHTCLLSVGEVAVELSANPGEGGRNQQFALWCAAELARRGQQATVLSAGSDGIDGHSVAAGAVCDEHTVERAAQLGLFVESALAGFNTAPLLRALGADIVTGPSGNNLRDLRLILTTREE
jgi:hydroxypyruvate reductase